MSTSTGFHISVADCCSAFAATRPASLPQTRAWHRLADQFLAGSRPSLVPLLIGLGALASWTSSALTGGLTMLPLTGFFFVAGVWCLLNFARSREAHCVVDGFGWTGLATISLMVTVAGIEAATAAWIVFVAILVLAILFETAWANASGTTALRRAPAGAFEGLALEADHSSRTS
jgi:hypothetical protein